MVDEVRKPEEQAMTVDISGDVEKNEKKIESKDAIRKLKKRLIPGLRYTLLCSLVIYFAMFIIGVLSVKNCPVNENIPLFLCITGFVGLASKLVTYLRDRIIPHFKIKYVESALYTTESIFFILGTYWVYKEFQPSYDPLDGSEYCQKRAYLFAFIYITIFYALLGAVVIITICICCCACFGFTFMSKILEDEANVKVNESQLPYIDEEVKENDCDDNK